MEEKEEEKIVSLSWETRGSIFTQGVLLAVSSFGGSAIEKWIFGPAAEKRMLRLEKTLNEVKNILQNGQEGWSTEQEEFIGLLEKVFPYIAKSTVEAKRIWFRNLLVQAAHTPALATNWDEADLAADLLIEIDPPGLEIISLLYRADYSGKGTVVILEDKPILAFWPENEPKPSKIIHFNYHTVVIEEWMRRLVDLRIIRYSSPIHRKTKEGKIAGKLGHTDVEITRLGKILITWGSEKS
jgi:hypothetical protein